MKRYLLAGCTMMIMANAANAQDAMTPMNSGTGLRFGLEAGAQVNNMLNHYQGETVSNQLKVGFHGGAVMDIGISEHFSIQPALRYSLKGGQVERSFDYMEGATMNHVETKQKVNLHYIELPINAIYKFGSNDGGGNFFVGAGGYVAALAGAQNKYKTELEQTIGENTEESKYDNKGKLNIGNRPGQDHVRRWDYGVQGLVGYQLPNGWYVKGTGQFGLNNILPGGSALSGDAVVPRYNNSAASAKNISYLVSIGYMF